MDAESLQKSERRRGRCLDVFLVVSIIFLFVAVTAVAAGGLLYVTELRTKLDSTRLPVQLDVSQQTGEPSYPGYKMRNFVYLDATSNKLQNCTMPLSPVLYGTGTSVGINFSFDKKQNSVKPLKEGTYFLYVELNITCTHICSAGVLSVSVDDKLTCKVELPALDDSTAVSKKCWAVTQIKDQRLNAQMTVPENGLMYWQLELKGSGIGMFLLD